MTTYGYQHYRDPYHNTFAANQRRADLTGGDFGNRWSSHSGESNTILGSIEIPNDQFNSLIGSNLGHLWNVYP